MSSRYKDLRTLLHISEKTRIAYMKNVSIAKMPYGSISK